MAAAAMDRAFRARERVNVHERFDFSDKTKVGEGTYGVVFQGFDKLASPVTKVAVKQIKTTKEGEGISLTACREITLLRELSHENIIGLLDIYLNPADKSLFLVFEYAEHDLYEIIKYHRDILQQRPSDFCVKSILWQLVNGINYLHANWVIHRDLKPSNILVMSEGIVKIGDFGLARIFQSPLRPLSDNGVVVTIWYRAPELLLGAKHYTKAVDIWAIGCIFAELLTTKPLFPGKENPQMTFQEDQLEKVFKTLGKPTTAQWPSLIQMPEWKRVAPWPQYPNILRRILSQSLLSNTAFARDAFDLLTRMLEYDPAKRISAAEALDHQFFKEAPQPALKFVLSFIGVYISDTSSVLSRVNRLNIPCVHTLKTKRLSHQQRKPSGSVP